MNNSLAFEPIFPSHAVERCNATIMFSEALPTKVFAAVVEEAKPRFHNAGLEAVAGPTMGFQIEISTGQPMPTPFAASSIYTTADRATQFIVAQNSLAMRTGRYVRWSPFIGQMDDLLFPLLERYSGIVDIANIQLDYTDRFLWADTWDTFDWRRLLREDSGFIARRPAAVAFRQWHSHTGWFEGIASGRRLVNVNIDLGDVPQPERVAPSVGILTLMREETLAQGTPSGSSPADQPPIQARFEGLHNALKTLLCQIITAEMAQRISLNAEQPDASH
jgi:uncharacterized protein (TIGR04255 family)